MALLDYLQNIPSVIIYILLPLILHRIITYIIQRRNFPPGPIGLPVVGYLPFLTKNVHLKLMDLGEKYGEVFSIQLGSKPVVVLNSANIIREAFSKSEFLGRPPNSAFTLLGGQSPFFEQGFHIWQEQRRFVLQSMKDLGLGKSKIEGHILLVVSSFMDMLAERDLSRALGSSRRM